VFVFIQWRRYEVLMTYVENIDDEQMFKIEILKGPLYFEAPTAATTT